MAYFQNGYYTMQPQGVQSMQQPQQIANGGLVSVRSEQEARNYPVAPGNSVTFKDETAPYVYTKTMGFSQLDRPIFEKFKLIKEDVTEASDLSQNEPVAPSIDISMVNELKGKIEGIQDEIEGIHNELEALKKKTTTKSGYTNRKKEASEDVE